MNTANDLLCQHTKEPNIPPLLRLLNDRILVELSGFFKVMGDHTRVKIIYLLSVHEMCVCDIANILNIEQSAISHQLKKLKQAKFVKYRREGKSIIYSLDDNHIKEIFKIGLNHLKEIDNK